ncbi:MAG TPA: hypothetical protein PK230_04355 [Chitinophagales bacterium]|nr:hypothetical protein [Chitinophagales bacterium]
MAYSKFTSLIKFCHQFGLNANTTTILFKDFDKSFALSERLIADLEEAKQYPMYSEKAKSELIITPILKELKRKNPHISVFSGFNLSIDQEPDLSGNPDFVLSAKPNLVEIEAPIFCLMESKNKAPDEGFAQCAAEMYAARLFNRQNNDPYETIHGAVTNGFEWVFLRLDQQHIFIDTERYYLNQPQILLSILQHIVCLSAV